MKRWKPGDIVQLMSGGPFMTVTNVDADGTTYCSWFVKDEQKTAYFSADALKQPGA